MGLFSAALVSSPSKSDHRQGLPFSRSYGDILPSSLATFPSIALESSSHLPVSDCGTGTVVLARGFSWRHGIGPIDTKCLGILLRVSVRRICLPDLLQGSVGDNRRPVRPILPRSPIADNEPAVVLEC
jgi:hypothetical protein